MPSIFGKSQRPCKDPYLLVRYVSVKVLYFDIYIYMCVNGDQFHDYSINTSAYVNYCFLIRPFKSCRLFSFTFNTSTDYWRSWTYFKMLVNILSQLRSLQVWEKELALRVVPRLESDIFLSKFILVAILHIFILNILNESRKLNTSSV
jgi:hypothetical protein